MERDYIKQGDCLQLMDELPDKSIDMILCDLPYGETNNPRDRPLPFGALWRQYKRIIKSNGAVLLFGQGKFFIDLAASNRKWYRYDLIWDKVLTTGFLNAKRMPLRRHEKIAVFYNRLPTYHPQYETGAPLHGRGKAYLTKEYPNRNYGKFGQLADMRAGSREKYPTSILRYVKPHPSKARHPTEKPVPLLEYLIQTYTNTGETVLDNCMGSGSTAVACIRSGRHYIGYELEEEYYSIAKRRTEEEQNRNDGYLYDG